LVVVVIDSLRWPDDGAASAEGKGKSLNAGKSPQSLSL
jgi:hypothetical protein